jgi:hypothetical protein
MHQALALVRCNIAAVEQTHKVVHAHEEFDSDDDGVADEDEFVAYQITNNHTRLDLNGDNQITLSELLTSHNDAVSSY